MYVMFCEYFYTQTHMITCIHCLTYAHTKVLHVHTYHVLYGDHYRYNILNNIFLDNLKINSVAITSMYSNKT